MAPRPILSLSLSLLLLLALAACTTLDGPDPALATQVTPRQLLSGHGMASEGETLVWGGTVNTVTNLRERTLIEILSYPLDRKHEPLLDRPASGSFVLEMEGFIEPAEMRVGLPVTSTGRYAGMLRYREGEFEGRLPRLQGNDLQVWAMPPARATRQRPDVRWSIGVGTHGSGVGVSIGL